MQQTLQGCAVGNDLSRWLDDAIDQYKYRFFPTQWEERFAWLPVTVHGKTLWLKKYYSRTVVKELNQSGDLIRTREYGTIFDLLRSDT